VINGNAGYTEADAVGIANKRVVYQFVVGDSLVEERSYVGRYKLSMLADNGLPLKVGDQFELVYSGDDPSFHRLNYDKVSPETMRRYLTLASNQLQNIYADDWQEMSSSDQKVRALCMSLLIFREYGYDGLSKVIFHDANFLDNFSHNSVSWYFMRRKERYEKIYHSCEHDPLFMQE
jgi:hypothetical protein